MGGGGGEEEKRRKDNTSGTLSRGLRALTFHVSAAVKSVDSFPSLENCVNCRLPSTLLPANYENEEEGKRGDGACLRRGGKMRRMSCDSIQASHSLPYSQTTPAHFIVGSTKKAWEKKRQRLLGDLSLPMYRRVSTAVRESANLSSGGRPSPIKWPFSFISLEFNGNSVR